MAFREFVEEEYTTALGVTYLAWQVDGSTAGVYEFQEKKYFWRLSDTCQDV